MTLRSRILASVPLDGARLARDLEEVSRFPVVEDYSEYSFGAWRSFVLGNGDGDHERSRFQHHDGDCRPTALGRRVPYLWKLVQEHFQQRPLRWARLFTLQDGLLVSHRDFIEFDRPFHRVHLMLSTDLGCLHSEEDEVFHMRRGEVWFLDATTVHAACSLSGFRRVSLCLDFEADGGPPEQVLRARERSAPPAPHLLDRPPLEPDQLRALLGLRAVADAASFRELVRLLGAVHFYRRVGAAAVFDWLQEICRDHPALVWKAAEYRRFCIERRAFEERFDL